MEQTQVRIPELVLLGIIINTVCGLYIGLSRIVRALVYVIRRQIVTVRQEAPYVAHILKGGRVLITTQEVEKINKYHTRYDHSARGNANEDFDLPDGTPVKRNA